MTEFEKAMNKAIKTEWQERHYLMSLTKAQIIELFKEERTKLL